MAQSALAIEPQLILPRIARFLRATAAVASGAAILVGALVLVGWWLDIELLKQIVPGLVAMNPITAICFIALGVSLSRLMNEMQSVRARQIGRSLAFFAAAVGLVKIITLLSP